MKTPRRWFLLCWLLASGFWLLPLSASAAPAAPAPARPLPDTSDDALAKLLAKGGEKHKPAPGDDDAPIDGDDDADPDDELDEAPAPKAKKAAAKKAAAAPVETDDDDALTDDPPAAEPAGDGETALEAAESAVAEAEADLDEEDRKSRHGLTPAQQKAFDKAIFKKREALRTARAELAEAKTTTERLTAELAEAKAAPPPPAKPTAENPLAHITTGEALEAELATVRAWRRWCQLNPDGGNAGTDDKPNERSAEQVRQILVNTEEILLEHAPRQRRFIAEQIEAESKAVGVYPWLKNPHAEQSVQVKAILRAAPQLAAVPNIKLILADHIANSQARQAAAAKPALPASRKPSAPARAPAVPGAGAPPPLVAGVRKAGGAAIRSFKATGHDPDNAALTAYLGGTR